MPNRTTFREEFSGGTAYRIPTRLKNCRATSVDLLGRFGRRVHAVIATVGGLDGFESSSSRASAGVFQSRVLRGLVLSCVAT